MTGGASSTSACAPGAFGPVLGGERRRMQRLVTTPAARSGPARTRLCLEPLKTWSDELLAAAAGRALDRGRGRLRTGTPSTSTGGARDDPRQRGRERAPSTGAELTPASLP
jgi:hypothetical protein